MTRDQICTYLLFKYRDLIATDVDVSLLRCAAIHWLRIRRGRVPGIAFGVTENNPANFAVCSGRTDDGMVSIAQQTRKYRFQIAFQCCGPSDVRCRPVHADQFESELFCQLSEDIVDAGVFDPDRKLFVGAVTLDSDLPRQAAAATKTKNHQAGQQTA